MKEKKKIEIKKKVNIDDFFNCNINGKYNYFYYQKINQKIKNLEQKEKEKGVEQLKDDNKNEIKEEKKKEIKKKVNIDDFFNCNINGKDNYFYYQKINQKIKNLEQNKEVQEIIDIPVILYLNNLRIVSIQKDNNDKEVINFIETVEEDENFIPKHFFEFQLINHIKKKLKIKPAESKNKKIIISIYSLNRDLSVYFKDLEEQINSAKDSSINNTKNDNECIDYLKKIGFYLNESLKDYNVQFKL